MRIVFCIRTLVVLLIGVTCTEGSAQRDSLWLLHKKKRKEMLGRYLNTRHGYVGTEGGLILDMGSTYFVQQGPGLNPNTTPYIFGNDYDVFNNFRIFAGYNTGSHYGEFSMGQVYSNLDFRLTDVEPSAKGNYKYGPGYWAFSARYYYALPIPSRSLRLLVGTEAGIGIPGPVGSTRKLFHDYFSVSTEVTKGGAIFLTGATLRLDAKLARNFTLFTALNFTAGIPGSQEQRISYDALDTVTGTTYPATAIIRSSVLNLNLNLGLKLDFYNPRESAAILGEFGRRRTPYLHYFGVISREERKRMRHDSRKKAEELRQLAIHHFHGYFGVEGGLMLNLGPTTTSTTECADCPINTRAWLHYAESMRFFAGIAFPDHHIELGTGGVMSRVFLRVPDSWYTPSGTYGVAERYWAIFARYYYRIPIPSSRFRLLIGPELGIGVQLYRDLISGNAAWMDYELQGGGTQGNLTGLAGGNIRLDTKLARNFTLFLQTSVIGGFGAPLSYTMAYRPTSAPVYYTANFDGSILNMNFTLGFKFDFYEPGELDRLYDLLMKPASQ